MEKMEKLTFTFFNDSGLPEEQAAIKAIPLTASFQEIYGSGARCAAATIHPEDQPDQAIGVILFRTFLDLNPKEADICKYVAICRFYEFGSFATIDLISFKDVRHNKDIAYRHLQKIGWLQSGAEFSPNALEETLSSPFLIAGGYLEFSPVSQRKMRFTDSSQDYGGLILGGNVNDLAYLTATACGLTDHDERCAPGKLILEQLTRETQEHICQTDFYESVYRYLEQTKTVDNRVGTSLLMMKAFDRAVSENKDLTQMMVEEMSTGFARTLMIDGMSRLLCPTSD